MINQLTIFLQNEPGRLAAACRAVSKTGANMHALSLSDTADFGVLRIICDKPQATADALAAEGWRAAVTPVLAVHVPNVPGGLVKLLEAIEAAGSNVEYGYCFSVNDADAIDVLKAADAPGLEETLAAAGFAPVKAEDVYTVD